LQLSQLASMQNPRLMPKSAVEQVVLLVHKLHGIISSVLSKVVFQMFYKWFFVDNAFHVLIVRLVESFWDMPRVLNPILSFYAELIHNKSMRIQFDSNSPAGVILFKETCKIVQT
jgi:exportin-7